MKQLTAIMVMAAMVLWSCKKDQKPTYIVEENSKPTKNQQPTVTPALNNIQNPGVANNVVQQVPAQTVQNQPQQIVVTPEMKKTGKGLNPAHGQPGHRCDIAVGAPLSLPIQKQNVHTAPASSQNNMVVNPVQTPAKVKTAPGMNPPHGEPNHRCDIAVGAPLNSPPANQSPAPTTTVETIQNNTVSTTEKK